MKKLFGTDGVRGKSNVHPITVETALALGKAAATVFRNNNGRHRIVIGKDTRLSGYMLETALASGICSMGVDVLLVGPLPTPGIAFITKSLRADAGIVISASHNPFEDNGIKFFSSDGFKLSDRKEMEIEELVLSGEINNSHVSSEEIGKAFRIDDASGRYIEFVKNSFTRGKTMEGLKIVLDCANGAAYKVGPAVLRELGAEVSVINAVPDGKNINAECGALYPEKLAKEVLRVKADVGIALDGDADRLILVDEKGVVVDGDAVMAMCGLDLIRQDALPERKLVATVMSNMGLDRVISEAGGMVIRADVGDRYVIEKMIQENASFGGEQSGHIILRDYTTTGDGLLSACRVLDIMIRERKSLSELAHCFSRVPQVLINLRVTKKKKLSSVPGLEKAIEVAEKKLKPYGRVLVRYSGTEKKVRVMVEGDDEKYINKTASELIELLRADIGADKK